MTQPRRKILMLTTQLGYGGAETSFIRLANLLAQSMDVTVALFTRDYGKGAYAEGHEPLQAQVVLLDGPPCGQVKRWWNRITALRKLKAQHDVAISFLSGPNLVNVLAGYNWRTVVSLRGSRMYDPVATKFQRRLFQYVIDPIVFYLAARIVPVSEGLKYEIARVSGKAALTKVSVISPFIDVPMLQQRLAESAPDKYLSLQGQKVIVAAGRLSVEKGFQYLLPVFAEVAKREPGVKLLLIGDGPMLAALQDQCRALGLAIDAMAADVSSVIFAGYQKNVLALMKLGRVYAMTSATEGFPNVLLEAMLAGLPVIAADTPWGARAILRERSGDAALIPYPTTQMVRADYGTLMPRIDAPEYQAMWLQALHGQLTSPVDTSSRRVEDYTVQKVGVQWRALIEEMTGLPVLYIVDPSIAVTGAFVAARNTARALAGKVRVVLVLPDESTIPLAQLTDFWRVRYMPMGRLSKNVSALLHYVPSLLVGSWRLRQWMRQDGAMTLQLNDFYLMQGAVLRVLGFRGHIASWVRCNPKAFAGFLARPMLFLMEASANRVVAVSQYIRGLLSAEWQVDVVYEYYTGAARAPRVWGAHEEKPLVYVGNYIPGKGQDMALAAFAKAAASDATLKLYFYGGDMGLEKNRAYRRELEVRAQQLGMTDRVVFGGLLADSYPALEGAYAALNFSQNESFSMTVFEASGAGVAVIATASGGPQEIVADGVTGYLIPVGDVNRAVEKIMALAQDPARAAAMGEAGAARIAQDFSKQAFYDRLQSVLAIG